MQALSFALRVVLSAAAIAAQVYLMMNLPGDIFDDLRSTLTKQTALQIAAAALAPAGLRYFFAVAAAWVSIIIGIVVAGAWATFVVPFAAIMAISTKGDYTIMIMLLSITAYLAIPFAVMCISAMLDE